MLTMPRKTIVVVFCVGLLLMSTSAFVLAQDHGHTAADCDIDALVEHQLEHAAALETLSEDLEHDPEAALEALYITGIAYQALAMECGFSRTAEAEEIHELEHDATSEADAHEIAATIGDPENGEVLFTAVQPENGFACATCHRTDSTERLVGPGLLGVGSLTHDPSAHEDSEAGAMGDMDMEATDEHADAEATEEAHTERTVEDVVAYLRTSITHPNDFIVPGYPESLMPQTYGEILTEAEIDDLIAYLLTLQ